MGDTERPIPERLGDQDEQALHLVRTGNGPTVDDEAALLAQVHGAPDMAGFYTGPETGVDEAADEPAEDVADQDAPTDGDTAKGGASA
ncbi:hypothetical protein OHA98_42040 [Streptomyces sp. NBC_00654]|uniref:hypothetical protein n=1 Tax=Streptomyces sp. NBC_00654 TaxID=2975799 RepID=UPI00224E98A5|nr:hypothetical protein [Streptomyces sp. NBC_00654]MCX4969389.1 hypothetical protein [Streptomyces sp. NBC_00654]MCX4971189.1 hypothetical protein [Streptomyces sp. NBC_00654]